MFTTPWFVAVVFQVAIAAVACVLARRSLKIPWRTALLAATIFNAIPVAKAPGFETPLFIHDMITPVLLILVLARSQHMPRGLFMLALVGIAVWPILGVLNSVSSGAQSYGWVTFLYRRVGFLAFLLAGACAFREMNPRDVVDTYVAIWASMCLVGLLQYFGMLNTDFVMSSGQNARSILDDIEAQRGFLGLNRGAVGSFGALIIAYSAAQLMLGDIRSNRVILYTASVALSGIVVVFSGSRTGLSAALAGVLYVSVVALRHVRRLRVARLAGLVVVGVAGAAYLAISLATTVVGRRLESGAARRSVDTRLEVQQQVLNYALSEPLAGTVGMGDDPEQFVTTLRAHLTHAHSEYFEVLWSTGFVGLAIYILLLYRLFMGMTPRRGADVDVTSVAIRGMFIAGLITGLAVGNILIVASRLASFGMAMLFVYGLLYGRVQRGAAPRYASRRSTAARGIPVRRPPGPLQPALRS